MAGAEEVFLLRKIGAGIFLSMEVFLLLLLQLLLLLLLLLLL